MNARLPPGAADGAGEEVGQGDDCAAAALNNKQFNDYVPPTDPLSQFFVRPSTTWTPRVLKDGADSVGALGALNRVYINIGLFSEEWLLHFRPLLGGKPISPIPIDDGRRNSVYWRATEMQTPNMARFFLASTDPHYLKDAPGGTRYLTEDAATLRARQSRLCRALRALPLEQAAAAARRPRSRERQRTELSDRVERPTGTGRRPRTSRRRCGDRARATISSRATTSPPSCACRSRCSASTPAVRWRPMRSAATSGTISRPSLYKTLPSVGTIKIRHPVTGKEMDYPLPAGGRGYIRPASLVSVWSTAPFLQNNTVGPFEWSPSVDARMRSFQKSIEQMLWPETAREGSAVRQRERPRRRRDRPDHRRQLPRSAGRLHPAASARWSACPTTVPVHRRQGASVRVGPFPKGMPVGSHHQHRPARR